MKRTILLIFLKQPDKNYGRYSHLGPTGYGDSPYQCFSAFAGNPFIISPEKLRDWGLLSENDIDTPPSFNPLKIDFGEVIEYKTSLNNKAYNNFKSDKKKLDKEYSKFVEMNRDWLDDFCFFMAAKDYHHSVEWTKWDKDLVVRNKKTLEDWKNQTYLTGLAFTGSFSLFLISNGQN